MNILYYDCFAGISGDMHLGAMIDLGVSEEHLRAELAKLELSREFDLVVQRKSKNGIMGTKVDVVLTAPKNESLQRETKKKSPLQLKRGTLSEKTVMLSSNHHHRNLGHITALIMNSALSEEVKTLSLNIFMKVAVAEAKVHGKPLEEVHFHEVGAIDSIVDIVGAAICLKALKIDRIMASPVQLGGGFVRCEHGLIPVPAPATAEILKGLPIRTGLVDKEMTTPTGAAILSAVVDEFTEKLDFEIERIGYGLGTRDLDFPNVLRVYMGHFADQPEKKQQFLMETNIDDMSPEWFGHLEELLFDAGALDVFKTPIVMKKSRSAVQLSVLLRPEDEEAVMDILFKHTTTFGLRKIAVDKVMLQRSFEKLQTHYGEVTIKKGYYHGQLLKCKPEYDECVKLAKAAGISLDTLYRAINKQLEEPNDR